MKRPLLWILGVWIVGEIAAHALGMSLVPVTTLDLVMADRDSASVKVTGTVRQFRHTSSGYAYLLSDNLVLLEEEEYDTASSQILVYSDDISELTIGNVVTVTGKLSLFDVPSNPGQFDLHSYYLAQGIGWRLNAKTVTVDQDRTFPAEQFLWDLRENLRSSILAVSTEEEAGIFLSVFLGDRSMMDSEIRDLYQTGGISHVLAISGLHISLFGMALHEMLRKLACPMPLNLVLSGGILTAYVLMTGCAASACRALVMFLVFLLAKAVGRTYDLLSALSLAGILLLADHPLLLWEGSFQLSFLAMAAVGAVWPVWQKAIEEWEKKREKERENEAAAAGGTKKRDVRTEGLHSAAVSLGFSLCIQMTTLPVVAWHYYVIPVYSMFLNLIVLPFAGLLLGSTAASAALGLFSGTPLAGLSAPAILPARSVLIWYDRICRLSEKLPLHSLVVGRPKLWQIVLYYVVFIGGMAVMSGWVKQRSAEDDTSRKNIDGCPGGNAYDFWQRKIYPVLRKYVRWAVVIWMLLLFLCIQHVPSFSLQITAIDVGQGDGIFVRCPDGRCCLIDGGSSSVTDVGTWRLIPFLKYQGVQKLDAILVSHGDADHINGLAQVLANSQITIGSLCVTDAAIEDPDMAEVLTAAENAGIEIRIVEQGQAWQWGSVSFTCLYPSKQALASWEEDKNNSSMVLRLQYRDFSALFTGDLAAEGEKELLRTGLTESVTLLKVGHHGSKNSSCEEFLKTLSPELALISCGEDNSYGHPHAETLERLEAVDTEICRTDRSGALTVTVRGGKISVERYREATEEKR